MAVACYDGCHRPGALGGPDSGVDVESVVLTGGASRRMGEDKASVLIDGRPQALAILERLSAAGLVCTVLGRDAIPGHGFLLDEEDYKGPASALKRLAPTHEFVFVASCDMPRFDERIVRLLRERIGSSDACVPRVQGHRQPLCALYHRRAMDWLKKFDGSSINRFLDTLVITTIDEAEFGHVGISVASMLSANTREELERIVQLGEK